MKQISLIVFIMTLLLSSCGHDDPPASVEIPIYDSFVPASIVVNRDDTVLVEECRDWTRKSFVVTSVEEIPDDPFKSTQSFSKIGFSDQALLIYYDVHSYDVLSCSNKYIRNNTDKTYEWTINLGINGDAVDSFNQLILTRYAILVPKLQKNYQLKVWSGVKDYNWNWD